MTIHPRKGNQGFYILFKVTSLGSGDIHFLYTWGIFIEIITKSALELKKLYVKKEITSVKSSIL